MSTLLIQELKDELSQEFKLNLSERFIIASFAPYLYIHNAPAGTFTLDIIKNSAIIYSVDFTAAEIIADMGASSDYVRAFYPFLPDFPLAMEKGTFTAKLSATGYAYNNSSFIGWIQQHEDLNNLLDYVPVDDTKNPLAMRIKIYKQGLLV